MHGCRQDMKGLAGTKGNPLEPAARTKVSRCDSGTLRKVSGSLAHKADASSKEMRGKSLRRVAPPQKGWL